MTMIEKVEYSRLPLGHPDFVSIREKNKIYVDKTELIYEIASQDYHFFISRPRRFGKSLLINTLASLFANGLKYFQGLAIDKKWKDKIYQVVHLDFSSLANKNIKNFKHDLSLRIVNKFKRKCRCHIGSELISPDSILDEICENLDINSVVLLIDEYDAPLTHHLNEQSELKDIMEVLNDFYAVLKQYTSKFRFIFITGVTRASHVSIFSAFNNLVDLSLKKEFSSLLGFTQNDLEQNFDSYIENAALVLKTNKEDIYQKIKQNYDGFFILIFW